MPKQNLTLISHSALTNHRIVAYEGEPYPEEAFHQTSPELPDLVHVYAVPGEGRALSPLVLLQAYGELMGSDYESLGELLGRAGRMQEAITTVQRGIQLDPYDDRLYKSLALLCSSARRYSEAMAAMKKELDLFPQDDFIRALLKKAEAAQPAP